MKTKKMSKKLSLNKLTITNIGNEEMQAVEGGDSWTCSFTYSCSCDTFCFCSNTCETCVCVSVQTGCYPNCTIPACPI
jgi:hypothetical protein